jgi:Tol biopolymer transport system component
LRTDLQRLKRDSSRQVAAAIPEAATAAAAQPAHASSSSAVVAAAKRHKWGVLGGVVAALIVLSAAGIGVYSIVHRPAAMPFQNFTVTQVTNSGKAALTAISPDGKYLLSVMDENGLQSLWLRNLPTGSDTQIIPPSGSQYESLAFSPDGNYIYFLKAVNATQIHFDLYRAPILGGTPQRLVRDIDTNATFSPNGQRIAYIRGNYPDLGKYSLLTAALDGRDEKVLYTESIKEFPTDVVWSRVAWSPTGNQIVYTVFQPAGALSGINSFNLASDKAQRLAVFNDKVVGDLLKWLPGGEGVILTYSQKGQPGPQIGFLPKDGDGVRPITRDTNRYSTLGVSGDGKTLATVQWKRSSNIYLLPGTGSQSSQATPFSSPVQNVRWNTRWWFNWGADGSLLITDRVRMWRMKTDGKSPTELLADSTADIWWVSGCGSRYFALVWNRGGTTVNIWRVDADGSGAVQLTRGKRDVYAVCSPDQKWVYYLDQSDRTQIARVALDGSAKPQTLTAGSDFRGSIVHSQIGVSTDGTTLAYVVDTLNANTQERTPKIALLNLGLPTSPRLLDVHAHISGGVQFTPDGKALAYPIEENGADNVWSQPLNGSAGHRITNFDSDGIECFFWSPDGKTLGVLRRHLESDVVLLQESKQ